MNVYKITDAFEEAICKYTGAKYCVALDNMSNALFLALYLRNITLHRNLKYRNTKREIKSN